MGLVVGLTGGIGSGKSAAAERFSALDVPVVDTDAIAHQLTGPGGAAMGELRAAFGNAVVAPDGRLDRAVMRRLAFTEPEVRRRLEAILHPRIRAEAERSCRQAFTAGAAYLLLVVPLLLESGGYRDRVDRILVVDCDDGLRLSRVVARSGLGPAEVEAIMAAQASRAQRLAAADDVIDNGGSLADLDRQVRELHGRYRVLAGAG